MTKPQITAWVLFGVGVALIAYDLVAVGLWGNSATESQVILHAAHAYPVIPFAFGVLMGHFFASQKDAP